MGDHGYEIELEPISFALHHQFSLALKCLGFITDKLNRNGFGRGTARPGSELHVLTRSLGEGSP